MKIIYKVIIIFCLLFACFVGVFSIYSYICISQIDKNLMQGKNLLNNFDQRLCFYDDNNVPLASTFSNGKTIASLDEMPDYVKYAFISIEDKNFYNHKGINTKRIIKSVLDNIFSGYAKSGASTISQQLVKNLHLSSEKTLKRKIQEMYLTKKLEKNYSKDEILETYLNIIYFGNNAIGIENASNKYFDCHAKDLKIYEAATLAGIIKSPSLYSPINNSSACIDRRNVVLKEMFDDGYITEEEYLFSKNQELNLKLQQNILDNNLYYKECINEAEQILNLDEKTISESNYKIYTYLNNKMQNSTIQNLKQTTKELFSYQSFCSVILDNKTNGVLAYVSNLQSTLTRQPGSLIKPILCYAPAFEEGILSPLTPIDDSPLSYENWKPQNANNQYSGYISTRQALSESKNIPAIKTLSYVGIENAKSYATQLGITFDETDNHLALALGSMKNGVSILTLSSAYSVFSNDGQYDTYHFIRKIEDYAGRIIYECPHKKTPVFSPETTYLINDILLDCSNTGTAKRLSSLGMKLASKTGTVGSENGNTDAWCISYNKNLSVLSWVGNATGKPENNLNNSQNGGTITANMNLGIWEQNKNFDKWFTQPGGVLDLKVDLIDYNEKHILNLAINNTPDEFVINDIFNFKYAPSTYSTNFLDVKAPTLTLVANDGRIYFKFDEQEYLSYNLYCNFRLVKTNVHSGYSISTPENSCFYYLVAKNPHTNKKKQSNYQVFIKENSPEYLWTISIYQ